VTSLLPTNKHMPSSTEFDFSHTFDWHTVILLELVWQYIIQNHFIGNCYNQMKSAWMKSYCVNIITRWLSIHNFFVFGYIVPYNYLSNRWGGDKLLSQTNIHTCDDWRVERRKRIFSLHNPFVIITVQLVYLFKLITFGYKVQFLLGLLTLYC
jgi:hypothetical protein